MGFDISRCAIHQNTAAILKTAQNNAVREQLSALCQAEVILINAPVDHGRIKIHKAFKIDTGFADVQYIKRCFFFDVTIQFLLKRSDMFHILLMEEPLRLAAKRRVEDTVRTRFQ